jgi:hypothetical protein
MAQETVDGAESTTTVVKLTGDRREEVVDERPNNANKRSMLTTTAGVTTTTMTFQHTTEHAPLKLNQNRRWTRSLQDFKSLQTKQQRKRS